MKICKIDINLKILKEKLIPLISFNTLAQVVPIVFIPFLANIFSPGIIGQMTLFNSLSLIISELGSLKYDQAIIVAKDRREAFGLFQLSIYLTLAICFVLMMVAGLIMGFFDLGKEFIFFDSILYSGIALFFSVLLNQINKSLFLYYNRFVTVRAMSILTVIPILIYNAFGVGLGLVMPTIETLVLVKLASFALVFVFLYIASRRDGDGVGSFDFSDIKSYAIKYSNYPKFILPGKMLNMITLKSVDILLASFFGNAVLGQYAIARRFVMVPETTISKAVSDIFRRQGFDKEGNANPSKVKSLFYKYLYSLVGMGVLIFSVLYFVIPFAVDILLDDEWTDVTFYSRILVFGFFASFVISPLTSVLRTLNKEKAETVFQIFFMLVLLTFSVITWKFDLEVDSFIVLLSVHRGISFMFVGCILGWVLIKKT